MLSGFHRREDFTSAAFSQHRTNVEAAVSPGPAPMTLGALQTMLECLSVPFLNTQGSMYSRGNSTKPSYGERPSTHGHFHKGQLSKSDSVSASSSDEMRPNFKRSPSQESNGNLQPLSDASVGSIPTRPGLTGRKQHLDDDQILQLIENKLEKFRAQMKALKETSSSDALKCKSLNSPQGCTSITSAVTGAVKPTEKMVMRAIREKEHSKGSRQDPEGTQMKSAPEGARPKSAPEGTGTKSAPEGARTKSAPEGTRTKSAPEGTRPKSAPEGTRPKSAPEGARPKSAPEGARTKSAPEGARTQSAPEGARPQSAPEGARPQSAPEGARPQSAPEGARPQSAPEGARPQSAPEGAGTKSAPEGAQRKSAMTEKHPTEHVRIIRETATVRTEVEDKEKDSSEVLGVLPGPPLEELVKENQSCTVHLKPPSQVYVCAENDLRSPQKDRMKEEDILPEAVDSMLSKSPPKLMARTTYNQPPFGSASNNQTFHTVEKSEQSRSNSPVGEKELIESVEKGVQTSGRSKMDSFPCKSERLSILRDPKYEDITDDECDVTPQVSAHAVTNPASEVAVPPTPEQQDCFEKVPKCAQVTSFLQQEVHSEEESDSEEVILFATELVLMDEIIVLDSSEDEEEEEIVCTADQRPIFQKLEEFETLDSFFQLKLKQLNKNLPNPLEATKAKPGAPTQSDPPICSVLKSLSVEKVGANQVSPHCSSQKHGTAVEKATEDLGIFEKFSPEQVLTHGSEDSSDTEDSLDYPSDTKSNYLTVSNQVSAPSLQSCDSNGEEQGEASQASTLNSSEWFPKLSSDESEDEVEQTKKSINYSTVVSKTTTGPIESTELHRSRAPFTKAKYKSRHIIESDSESEQDGSETCSFSAEASTQLLKRQESFKSKHNQPDVGPETSFQKSCSGQNGASVLMEPVHQNQAIRQERPATNPRSDTQVKRKRLSSDTGEQWPQNMPKKVSRFRVTAPHEANAQNADLNMPKDRKFISRRSSLPNQTNGKSLEAKALSLPVQSQSQPTPPSPPKSHKSFLKPQVNSYSTAESTPAKQTLVENWSETHISIPKERRSSYDAERMRKFQDVKMRTRQSPPKPRKRHNSLNLQTQLMKKTKLQAQTLTKAVHHKESTMQSQVTLGEGYKWKDKTPVVDHTEDDDWLEKMHGEPLKRPHY